MIPSGVPDGELAFAILERALQKGLLTFAPVGPGGASVKICPPLIITEDAIRDGLSVLDGAIAGAAEQLGQV